MNKLDKVKVELRHHNVTENEAPINLGIRSQEAILPEAASNYTVSLLKFATSFNAPILHIPEDDPLEFGIYPQSWSSIEDPDYEHGFKLHGLFKDMKDFCYHFNLVAGYVNYIDVKDPDLPTYRYKPYQLSYDESTSKLTLLYIQKTPYARWTLHYSERTAAFFRNWPMEVIPKPDFTNGTYRIVISDSLRVVGEHPMLAASDDNWPYYNFDYVQLATDLPIAQTLLSTTVNNQSTVVKMSTLGTVQTNSATQDAYYVGGLVYLPNFMITSSLNSDTPLYNFKIEPYLFYKTGHYERMKLKGGGSESTYALIEFEPKE